MDALDIAFAEKLDAVITDVLMPKMDGIIFSQTSAKENSQITDYGKDDAT